MSWDYQSKAPHAEAMRKIYQERGDNWQDYKEIVALLRDTGIAAINPLLTEEEHKILFRSRDPLQMAGIIIKGLAMI